MEYDIEALKRKMLVKYPFFGSVVASIDYKENKEILSAGTDGKVIYYNSDFLNGLNEEEQTFVFAHEVCHIAFNHILRSDGKDPQVWNIATDAVINAFLERDGLKIIAGNVNIDGAINYDAEQLYEKLLKDKKDQQEQGNNEQQQNQNESQSGNWESQEQNNQNSESSSSSGELSKETEKEDVDHDTHKMWEDAVKKHKKEQCKSSDKKGSLLDRIFNKDKKKEEQSEVEKKQEEFQQMGEKEAFSKNRQDKKQQLEELKEAIAKQVFQAGNSTSEDIITVNDIGSSEPLIDWRYVLREAIKYDVDWSYKNATIEDGVISANLEDQPMPETEIVLDTSGSINIILLKNFLRECKNILKYSRVKVGCFDTLFYGFQEIRTEDDIENIDFKGGGGTNFNVAVNAFSRRVENKIVFTDGEASMPDMKIDAVWIVFGNKMINPKGGKVIYINEDVLDRMYYEEDDYNLSKRR
ncbi:MAG: VWA-like domain-containing protein [Bacilli bacterium]